MNNKAFALTVDNHRVTLNNDVCYKRNCFNTAAVALLADPNKLYRTPERYCESCGAKLAAKLKNRKPYLIKGNVQ